MIHVSASYYGYHSTCPGRPATMQLWFETVNYDPRLPPSLPVAYNYHWADGRWREVVT
jgi:hypothetical protein